MKRYLWAGVLSLWAGAALAHSPLQASIPASDATLAQAPSEITLDFRGNIRLTRVTLVYAEEAADLDLDGFSGFISDYTIPVQPMGAGVYRIDWRGLGDDGHPMKGSFSFTVEDQ